MKRWQYEVLARETLEKLEKLGEYIPRDEANMDKYMADLNEAKALVNRYAEYADDDEITL